MMLRSVKNLHGDVIRAKDGEIGSVDEILFDDEQWTVRYLVANTGGWLHGRKVLIATQALRKFDWELGKAVVDLTREQVEGSPGIDEHKPISRQIEKDYYDNYTWPYYWGGAAGIGGIGMSGGMLLYRASVTSFENGEANGSQQQADERDRNQQAGRSKDDLHLRSTKEVIGYKIEVKDGHLGHVEDFIVDGQTWKISYLVVDTRDWWPGKKVLVPLEWISRIHWPDSTVTVDLTRDQIRNGPEWNTYDTVSEKLQQELVAYYDSQELVAEPEPMHAKV